MSMFLGGEVEEEDHTVECRKNAAYNFPVSIHILSISLFRKIQLYDVDYMIYMIIMI